MHIIGIFRLVFFVKFFPLKSIYYIKRYVVAIRYFSGTETCNRVGIMTHSHKDTTRWGSLYTRKRTPDIHKRCPRYLYDRWSEYIIILSTYSAVRVKLWLLCLAVSKKNVNGQKKNLRQWQTTSAQLYIICTLYNTEQIVMVYKKKISSDQSHCART